MSGVRVICLGNPHASDDGAVLRAVEQLDALNVIRGGRPGAALLDMLDGDDPVVLVDVTQSGAAPGTVIRLPLAELVSLAVTGSNVSSHGFGPGETLKLGATLGRPLPTGVFVGIEGTHFEVGEGLSEAVEAALPRLCQEIRDAVSSLLVGGSGA